MYQGLIVPPNLETDEFDNDDLVFDKDDLLKIKETEKSDKSILGNFYYPNHD